MDEISAFWAGAQRYGRAIDWVRAADAVGGAEALVRGGVDALRAAGVPDDVARSWLRATPYTTRGRAITLYDADYPARLREIEGAPPVLHVEGDAAALRPTAWAVVGTRRCSGYAGQVAREIGAGFAAGGVVVVSGLARGIDGHAHRGALSTGRTVAVLGHGLSFTSPASHASLRQAIVDRGGAIVTAFPDDVAPTTWTFPLRNAWIAGMSRGVVVVEAPQHSGAMITMTYAEAMGRERWVVPGRICDPSARGSNGLLGMGGVHAVFDLDDLVRHATGRAPAPEAGWLGELFLGATVEEVAWRTGRREHELLAELGRLEALGQVVPLPGRRYARA